MDFSTQTVDLSLANVNTGKMLTANVYNVQFNDGSTRVMSMGQLVMAICLERANEKESAIIDIMNDMAEVTENIAALSDIAQKLVDILRQQDEKGVTGNINSVKGTWTITYIDANGKKVSRTYTDQAQQVAKSLGVKIDVNTSVDTCISSIQAKLDELNTQSQQQLITLQSETSKRDQSYEMISNMLKSMFTVLSGVVNNV